MKDWQTVADKALLRKPKDERLNNVFRAATSINDTKQTIKLQTKIQHYE
jgi:hypothetical protein